MSLQLAIQLCSARPIDILAAMLASSSTTIRPRQLAWYLIQWCPKPFQSVMVVEMHTGS